MVLAELNKGLAEQETPNQESDGPQIQSDSDEENNQEIPPIPLDSDQETPRIPPQHHQSYHLRSINSTILIRQLPSQGLSFQLWPAATTLITLLDAHRHTCPPLSSLFNSRPHRLRILELGSGTGAVGITAAALLAADVTVTDLPYVLPNMKYNIDANAGILGTCGGAVHEAPLSWGEIQDMEGIGREYDVVMASDVVYYDYLYEPLLKTLKFFLLGSGKEVVFLMAHLRRWKKESAFFKKANKFFDVKVIHTDSPCDGYRVGVKVYLFVRKGSENLKYWLSPQ